MNKIIILICLFLGACAASQQREINAAYVAAQAEKATAAAACAASAKVASCMLGLAAIYGGGGASQAPPVVQSDLSAVLNSSVLGVGLQVAGGAIQARYARDSQIAGYEAQTAQQGQQWGAIAGIVSTTSQAQTGTALAGFGAIRDAGTANAQGMAQVANGAFTALGAGFAILPQLQPSITTTTIAGRDAVQGDGNDTSSITAGGDIRQQSPGPITIDMSQYQLVCTAAPAGNGGGTTGPGGASSQVCQWMPR